MNKTIQLSTYPNKKIPKYEFDLHTVTDVEDFLRTDEISKILKSIAENKFYVHTNPDCLELKIRSRGLIISNRGIFNIQKKDGYPFYKIILKDNIPYIELYDFDDRDQDNGFGFNMNILQTSELDIETINNHFYYLNKDECFTKINFIIKAFIIFPISLEAEGISWWQYWQR